MAALVAMASRQEGLQMHGLEHGCVSWERVPAGRGAGGGGGRRQRTLKVVLKVMSATARVVRTGMAELGDWLPQSAAA